jgi:hypothetical protein
MEELPIIWGRWETNFSRYSETPDNQRKEYVTELGSIKWHIGVLYWNAIGKNMSVVSGKLMIHASFLHLKERKKERKKVKKEGRSEQANRQTYKAFSSFGIRIQTRNETSSFCACSFIKSYFT